MGDGPWSAWILSTANVNAAGLRGTRCVFARDLEAAVVVCIFVSMYVCMYVRLSCAALLPRPVQLLHALEGSVADVQRGVHLQQTGLTYQRQAADAKIGVQRVWMAVWPFSKSTNQTVLSGHDVVSVLLKIGVLKYIKELQCRSHPE